MLVGGMPQAVNAYLETNNFKYVDEVKRDILNLYEADFYKIDPSGKISMLFAAIPSELSRDSSRYQVSSVLKNHRASAISNEISELVSSKTVLISYHVNDPAIVMTTSLNTGQFRLFMADTGLMVTLMFKDKDFTDNIIYEKLLSDTLPKNLGLFYENIVAQTLTCNGIKLFYNTYYDEIQKRIFEVDFLLAEGHKAVSYTHLDVYKRQILYSQGITSKLISIPSIMALSITSSSVAVAKASSSFFECG